ncbi:hypothetical protein MRB53_037498 [Persea americana]|nr:hypothetical protein MRB53_037498 [Persea americana]
MMRNMYAGRHNTADNDSTDCTVAPIPARGRREALQRVARDGARRGRFHSIHGRSSRRRSMTGLPFL